MIMSDQRVIDAYLGAHHDAPLSEAEEEQQLHEAEAELEAEIGITHEEEPVPAPDAPAREAVEPEAAENVKERAE
jgi:branched-chain amino acid transport system ATP-binding protein